jgi:hypothetical protein
MHFRGFFSRLGFFTGFSLDIGKISEAAMGGAGACSFLCVKDGCAQRTGTYAWPKLTIHAI